MIVAEGDDDALRPGLDLLDMRAAAHRLDRDDLRASCSTSGGMGPKRSIISAAKDSMSCVRLQRREAAIELQAQGEIGDVIFRDRHRRADGDGRRPRFFLRLLDARLQQRDRIGQHLLIELVADFLDMAGLLVAQQIAGAANVEIVARELEAGAERVERSAAPRGAFAPAA